MQQLGKPGEGMFWRLLSEDTQGNLIKLGKSNEMIYVPVLPASLKRSKLLCHVFPIHQNHACYQFFDEKWGLFISKWTVK